MNDREFNRPIRDIFYYLKLNNSLENEVSDFLDRHTNNPHYYGNDMRHQYVSALYARNFGNNTAKFLGDMNELTDFYASGRYDSELDKINNEIGRNYGINNPNISKENLLQILWDDYGKNAQYSRNKLNDMGF